MTYTIEQLESAPAESLFKIAFPVVHELIGEVKRLTFERDEAVNSVLNQAGDDLCRLNEIPVQIPPREEFLESCSRYHAQISAERGELSGCKTITQLEAEIQQLRQDRAAATETICRLSDRITRLEAGHDGR